MWPSRMIVRSKHSIHVSEVGEAYFGSSTKTRNRVFWGEVSLSGRVGDNTASRMLTAL